MKRRLPNLYREISRHKAGVWYVRKGKGKRIRLRAAYGTPEFLAEYQAALAEVTVRTPSRAAYGSIAWLVERYRDSAAWLRLSAATKRQRENIFRHILEASGDVAFASVTMQKIREGMRRREKTPAAARHFLETMRGLFQWAVDADIAPADPTAGIKAKRRKNDGFAIWTDADCAAFEAAYPLGTRERLAFDVLLYTGLRRGDAVKLGRQHVRNGVARIKMEKTGDEVSFPLHDALIRSIEAGPTGDLTFIVGERGEPLAKESFGNWFRRAARAAGIRKSPHGLRKTLATRMAEAGVTEHELMAAMGWAEARTAGIYTRKANRGRLSARASAKVQNVDGTPRTEEGQGPSPSGKSPEN